MQRQNWLRNLIVFKKLCVLFYLGPISLSYLFPLRTKNGFGFWEMFIDFIYQNLYLFYIFTEKFKQTHRGKKNKDNQDNSYLKTVQKVIQTEQI